MKIKNLLFFLSLGIAIAACNKDDKDNYDPVEQAVLDDEALIEYMQTHYLDEAKDTIFEIDNGQSSLYDDPRLTYDEITENDIDYKLYYLVQNEGETFFATEVDSVLTTYTGKTMGNIVFDTSGKSFNWFSLLSVIKGWSYGFTHFKGGTIVINPDESFYYENYGKGILFIPSGLAYGNTGSGSIPPNESLVFQITLQDINVVDDDNDTVLSVFEDLNRNSNFTDDDTDEDGIPNYLDEDDDGDGVLTKNEDADGNGSPLNDDTDGDGIPDYLDADTK